MLFNSYTFVFLFLPVTAIVFWQLARVAGRRVPVIWLAACSLFFYAYWAPVYLGLLAASIAINFSIGCALGASKSDAHSRKLQLTLGVVLNLGILGWFKYANFFVDTINALGIMDLRVGRIILPLAISFFTFQQIAYLVDAYQGRTREYNFWDYCLFVTFFPQLIAGPIVHHKEMLPQFSRDAAFRFDPANVSVGVTMFLAGLFKKVIIADNVAEYANALFDSTLSGATPTFFDAWLGVLAFTFQLYFDFSAYSDMAIGLGRIFGIQLPLNFNSPYKATNIIEFWRRWHITLSRFLRDYLYIPLGGNRKGARRRYVNLMITMLLGGLWHGAGWTFVFWGGLHGLYLCANYGWRHLCEKAGRTAWRDTRPGRAASVVVTFLAVMAGWVFFRAEQFSGALVIFRSMLGLNGFVAMPLFDWERAAWVSAVLLVVVWAAPNVPQLMARYEPVLEWERLRRHFTPVARGFRWLQWRPTPAVAVVTAVVALTVFMSMSRIKEFLYFQF